MLDLDMNDVIHAWRDLDYWESLTEARRGALPKSPAGEPKWVMSTRIELNFNTDISPGGTCDTSIAPDGCCSTSISPGGTCDTSIAPDGCCSSNDAVCNTLAGC